MLLLHDLKKNDEKMKMKYIWKTAIVSVCNGCKIAE